MGPAEGLSGESKQAAAGSIRESGGRRSGRGTSRCSRITSTTPTTRKNDIDSSPTCQSASWSISRLTGKEKLRPRTPWHKTSSTRHTSKGSRRKSAAADSARRPPRGRAGVLCAQSRRLQAGGRGRRTPHRRPPHAAARARARRRSGQAGERSVGARRALEARVRALTEELDARTGYRRVIGESAPWRQVLTQATQVAAPRPRCC